MERNALAPAEANAFAEGSPLVGTQADVLAALDAYAAAGAAEAIVDLPAPFDVESLRRLAAGLRLGGTPPP
jgi:alkanesulfonate monooxygenase SsuD/methylene tetrahydromethanopterin reductase-like flavin-dependent oxidoreductase (luciferase family)